MSDGGDVTIVGPPAGPAPRARTVRHWTTAAANRHGGASLGDLLNDVYYAAIMSAIAIGVALGVAGQLRTALPGDEAVLQQSGGPSLPALVAWALVAGVGALLSLAGRLGPVGVGGAEATWLLGMPVDRRGLLRPAARRMPLLAAVVVAVVVGVLDAGLLADRDAGHVLRSATAAALSGAVVVLVAALGQTVQLQRRTTALVGDLVLAAAPALALAGFVVGWSVPVLPTVPVVALGTLAAVAGLLWWVVDARLPRLPARTLRESGSVASQAAGALVSMDSRELGRALTDSSVAVSRRRARRFRFVRGPAAALVTADVMVLVRSLRHVVQVVVAALVPVLVAEVPQLAGPLGFALAIVLSGYAAASATGEGARRAEMAPALDRLLPLSAAQVRRLRMVVPAGAMLAWSAAAFGAVGHWSGDTVGWLVLGVASTPVWAAAAVRAAYRPAPQWGGPLVSTPMGAVPAGVTSVLARGPDVVVLGLIPVLIAVVLGSAGMVLVVVQVAFSAIAVAVASRTDTRSLLERLSPADAR